MNWHLDCHFTLVPQRDRSQTTAEFVRVVVQESIRFAVNVRWPDDDRFWEFVFDSQFSLVLKRLIGPISCLALLELDLVEMAYFGDEELGWLEEDLLRIWRSVQSREMNETLHVAFSRNSGDQTGSVHVHVFVGEVP